KRSRLIRWGATVTAAWLIFVVGYVVLGSEPRELVKPNQFGDFLGGSFAPIAFLWLVIAVLLQSNELALQRQELSLTRASLDSQTEQLRLTVEHMAKQTEILMGQADLSLRQSIESRLNGRIELLRKSLLACANAGLFFQQSDEPIGKGERLNFWRNLETDEFIKAALRLLTKLNNSDRRPRIEGATSPAVKDALRRSIDSIDEIETILHSDDSWIESEFASRFGDLRLLEVRNQAKAALNRFANGSKRKDSS
ncbi:MAG: hypothetical protein KDA57_23205, partial [Planctomycetales bacterium]|nr:hypothetical protein [Planctomycetales bacterium]